MGENIGKHQNAPEQARFDFCLKPSESKSVAEIAPARRPASQPSHQKTSQPTSQPASKPTSPNHPASHPTKTSASQPTSQPSKQPASQPNFFPWRNFVFVPTFFLGVILLSDNQYLITVPQQRSFSEPKQGPLFGSLLVPFLVHFFATFLGWPAAAFAGLAGC